MITHNTGVSVFRSGAAAITASFNDVFNPNVSNYDGLTDPSGQNGNTSVDPKYFNRANAQYQLRFGSPAIDSGTSTGASTTDHLGNPRFDDPNILNVNGGGTLPYFDRGAFERQESFTSDIDLATAVVTGPTAGLQDQVVTVNWTVGNIGVGPALGSWHDAVYLSVDPVWTPDDTLLGDRVHTGDLGPGQIYNWTADVTLPGVLPGNYYFIVRANSRQEVFEALSLANNSGPSSAMIAMDLPTLFLGTPLNGQLAATGRPIGLAPVRVVNTDNLVTTLPGAFNIMAGQTGQLTTNIIVPSRVRVGRSFTVIVEYANTGDTDLLGPVMRFKNAGFSTLPFSSDLRNGNNSLDLIAVNPNGPAGVLPPGARGSLTIYGQATASGDERFALTLADYTSATIDWAAISPAIRPNGLTDGDWNPALRPHPSKRRQHLGRLRARAVGERIAVARSRRI